MTWFRRSPPPEQTLGDMLKQQMLGTPEEQLAALEHEVLDGPSALELAIDAEFSDAQQHLAQHDQDERSERYLRRRGIIP